MMRTMNSARIFATVSALLLAQTASAHIDGFEGGGLAAGWMHPWGGIDHLLAMLVLGLWAYKQDGRSRWALPGVCGAALVMGAWFGVSGTAVPGLEPILALSVVAGGVLTALALRLPGLLGLLFVAAFGMVHGFAHGLEMTTVAPGHFFAGMLTSSLVLLAGGFGFGAVLSRAAPYVHRLAGLAVVGAGALLLGA